MVQGTISFESAKIGFRNFAGQEGPFNSAGDRNFAIFLDDDRARELEQQGWNIKWPKPKPNINPEDDDRSPHLPVSVSYKFYPPKVVKVTGDNMAVVPEEELGSLDWLEFENVDIVIRPYNWSVNGNSGVKAYLKAMYVTLPTDAFTSKYGI